MEISLTRKVFAREKSRYTRVPSARIDLANALYVVPVDLNISPGFPYIQRANIAAERCVSLKDSPASESAPIKFAGKSLDGIRRSPAYDAKIASLGKDTNEIAFGAIESVTEFLAG